LKYIDKKSININFKFIIKFDETKELKLEIQIIFEFGFKK